MRGGAAVKLFINLLSAFVVMVLLLWAVALLGGVGTVELSIWAVLLVAVLVAVAIRSRRTTSG